MINSIKKLKIASSEYSFRIFAFFLMGILMFSMFSIVIYNNVSNNNKNNNTQNDLLAVDDGNLTSFIRNSVKDDLKKMSRDFYSSDVSVSENSGLLDNYALLTSLPLDIPFPNQYILKSVEKNSNEKQQEVFLSFFVPDSLFSVQEFYINSLVNTYGWTLEASNYNLGMYMFDFFQEQDSYRRTLEISFMDFTNEPEINGVLVVLVYRMNYVAG